jgi:hypothetical protein
VSFVTQLMVKPDLLNLDGSKASLGKYDNRTNTIYIQTNAEEDVHVT